ncbi:MAG: hypothetical protein ACFFEF_12330 [Candidatus Thorarchaeota archaeon]
MKNTIIEKLTSENSDGWAEVYNRVMKKSIRYIPLAKRTLLKIVEALRHFGVEYVVVIEGERPSAIGSYLFDYNEGTLNIIDFCVLPFRSYTGSTLIEILLENARDKKLSLVSAWMNLNNSTSLDVLGEFLFIPGRSRVVSRCFMSKPPNTIDGKITESIPEDTVSPAILPFHSMYQIQSILESFSAAYYHAYTFSESKSKDTSIDVYLSDSLKKQAWIFPSSFNSKPTPSWFLNAALEQLYDSGVRDVLTEIDAGHIWLKPYSECGFEDVYTKFELTFNLEF